MASIAPYRDDQFDSVDRLWREAFPDDPVWNQAKVAIPAKLKVDPELFLVACDGGGVIGSIMAGYDGHRGWLYAVAVARPHRRQGVGRLLIAAAEQALRARGCTKINLQVRATNAGVASFYEAVGYEMEERISMGKRVAGLIGPIAIKQDDLTGPATQALLRLHLEGIRADTPPGLSFALDVSGLQAPSVSVWSAWAGDSLLGIGALKRLDAENGEIKSMRTHPDHLRRGVGATMLEHIISEARKSGLSRLSLETGCGLAFDAALALYRNRGFVEGQPFADYKPSAFNRFLHFDLE